MQPELFLMVFSVAVLIVSIIVHEVAHGYAANALGDPTAKLLGRLTLNPLPHIDLVGSIIVPATLILTGSGFLFGWAKPVPYNPANLNKSAFARRWGEFLVAIAGVATNLAIALAFALIIRGAGAMDAEFLIPAAATICITNLFLGLFNLLPIPPLDGFGVLRGALPYRFSLPLRAIEDRINAGGIASFILILFLFSYFLARPFSQFVLSVFNFLVGA